MSLKDVLNTDLATVGPQLRQGFVWWIEELSAIAPASWRGRRGDELIAEPAEAAGGGGGFRLIRRGEVVEAVDHPLRRPRRVTLMLPEARCLVREVELPALSGEDTRRMVALDIDRLTPFPAGAAYHDLQVIGRTADGARQSVLLGVVGKADALALVARARGLGLEPVRVAAGLDGEPRLDFLKAMRADAGGDPAGRRMAYWWTAVIALIAFNVFLLIFRDINDVANLRRITEAQGESVGLALRVRQAAQTERDARALLVQRRTQTSPLGLLTAVNASLPNGAWVHRLAWNGRSVRLVGFKSEGLDVVRALRAAPGLANVRPLAADQPAKAAAGQQPFDIATERGVAP